MSVKVKNISQKIIGIGEMTVLPGESRVVPDSYAKNPSLMIYKASGYISVSGSADAKDDKAETPKKEDGNGEDAIKELRASQLKALSKMGEDEIGKLANELGINPADCKDDKALKDKVKAELTKLSK